MKNSFFLIGSLVLSLQWVRAQENRYVSHSQSRVIAWEKPVDQDIPGIGGKSVMAFKKASFDFSKNFFPIYFEEVTLPVGTSSATISLHNTNYQPVSDVEKNAILSYQEKDLNALSNDVIPSISVSYYKKRPVGSVQFIPIRKNPVSGKYEKLVSWSFQIDPVINNNAKNISSLSTNYVSNSVLATGTWHKISVTKDGVYKMDGAFLKKLGIDPDSINPMNLRLYGNGGNQLPYVNSAFHYDDLQENSIVVFGEGDGKFDSTDYVLFYGQSQNRWKYFGTDKKFHHSINVYSDTTYYFINTDIGSGKRILTQPSSAIPPTNTVSSFDDYEFHELEQNNLLKSGRQWLGEIFDILTSYSFTFNFPNIITSSKVYAKVETAARRDVPGTDFSWSIGSSFSSFNVPNVTTSNIYSTYYKTAYDTISIFPAGSSIVVTVTKTSPSPAIGWLNYIELNARRSLTMNGGQLIFRDINSANTGNVSKFIVSNASSTLEVWDVTDPINVQLQTTNFSGGSLDFTLPTDSLKEFIAFNGQSFLTPKKNGLVQNQDLHAMTPSELLIVTNPLFLTQANALADLHRTIDNMTVSVATTEQIYNEFSSGAQDVSAIRNFVKMFYDRAADSTELPKYLLIFGRGSYDLKRTSNNTNYVPAYESLNSSDPTISYPSDDFYGMLDNNEGAWDYTSDILDIGVGRLPVKSVSEADITVAKITKYTSVPGTIETGNSCATDLCFGLGDWTNSITFCADDEDASIHLDQAEQLATKVSMVNDMVLPRDSLHNNYNIDKIYLDAYQQVSTPGGERYPDATNALNRRVERGSLIINYTGHGGELGWAHERFLEIVHINSWKNQCKLPLFFTATCEFSRWDDPDRTSAGELTLLNPNGGSIGLMSTTRVVYSGPNAVLNNNFYDYTFSPMANGKMPRLGDLHMLTKKSMAASQINHRNFSLLADPALSLNYPEYEVATTEINGSTPNPVSPDTIRALSQVTVKGEVRDYNGNLISGFNGIVYPTVYDKAASIPLFPTMGLPALRELSSFRKIFFSKERQA